MGFGLPYLNRGGMMGLGSAGSAGQDGGVPELVGQEHDAVGGGDDGAPDSSCDCRISWIYYVSILGNLELSNLVAVY